ncbi:hypothetical protein USDA257_p00590 (plasmid) [Sinorhizobium fredii USDA 257]|uniref:Uncharacterized protein n=1 Tax=Sinorhizobium fredii (strain USDA 257) TaxID=1185652 RepID=I3XFX1_SINF2|nr:hypothetical protein USDA257_p00590 [Sinorhizobium fredii USDA 257]
MFALQPAPGFQPPLHSNALTRINSGFCGSPAALATRRIGPILTGIKDTLRRLAECTLQMPICVQGLDLLGGIAAAAR